MAETVRLWCEIIMAGGVVLALPVVHVLLGRMKKIVLATAQIVAATAALPELRRDVHALGQLAQEHDRRIKGIEGRLPRLPAEHDE